MAALDNLLIFVTPVRLKETKIPCEQILFFRNVKFTSDTETCNCVLLGGYYFASLKPSMKLSNRKLSLFKVVSIPVPLLIFPLVAGNRPYLRERTTKALEKWNIENV